jgi:hypothetical protein
MDAGLAWAGAAVLIFMARDLMTRRERPGG